MDEIMDTKVVQMKFDNSQFRAGVQDTIKQLEQLDNSLELQGASTGLDNVSKASKNTAKSLTAVSDATQEVQRHFSALEIVGITVMMRLTNAALTYGSRMANNLWSKTFGQIISGGKARSQNIANAKFQLEGLGVAWKEIGEDINYGVKDTAYGLDEAAKAAAQMVASMDLANGYTEQQSAQMRIALRAISGVAAMTNSSYSDIADVFTTVSSNGKLMTMQLRQLAARGLNASAVLAKAMNKTEEEINNMVTQGKINFQEFAKAMDDAFGAHAKEANKTFQGALSNVRAALSRIGAKFAEPVYENLRKIFNGLIPLINNINKALDPVAEAFTSIVNTGGDFLSKFLDLTDLARFFGQTILNIYGYIRPIIIAFFEVFAQYLPYVERGSRSMGDFAKQFALSGEQATKVRDVFRSVFGIIDLFIHVAISAFKILKTIGKGLITTFTSLSGSMEPSLDILYNINTGLQRLLNIAVNFIQAKLEKTFEALANALKLVNWEKILNVVGNIVVVLAIAWQLLLKLIELVIEGFKRLIPMLQVAAVLLGGFITSAIQGFMVVAGLISSIFGRGKELVTNIIVRTQGMSNTAGIFNAGEAVQEMGDSTENLNDSLTETIEAIDEVNDRLETTDKNFRRVTKDIGDLRKEAGELTKGRPLGGRKTNDPDSNLANAVYHGIHDLNAKPIGSGSKNARQMGFFETLASWFVSDKLTAVHEVAKEIDDFFFTIGTYIEYHFTSLTDKIKEIPAMLGIHDMKSFIGFATTFGPIIGAIAIISRVLYSVFGILDLVGNIGRAIGRSSWALVINQLAKLITAMTLPIIAITGLVALIASISYFVDDVSKIQQVFDIILNFVVDVSEKIKQVLGYIIVIYGMFALVNLFATLADWMRLLHHKSPKTSVMERVTNLIKSFAILIASLAGAVYLLTIAADSANFDKATKVLLDFTVYVLLFVGIIAAIGYKMESATNTVKITWKGIEMNSTVWANSVMGICIGIATMLAVITGAIYLISRVEDMTALETARNFITGIMGGILLFLGALTLYCKLLTPKSTGISEAAGREMNGMAKAVANVAKVIRALGFALIEVAAALWIVSKIEMPTETRMLDTFIAISAVIGILTLIVSVLVPLITKGIGHDRTTGAIGAMGGMALMVTAFGGMLLALAASIKMLDGIDINPRVQGTLIAITSIVMALGAVIAGLMSFFHAGLSTFAALSGLSLVFVALGGMFLMLGNAIKIIAESIPINKLSLVAGILISIVSVVSGISLVLGILGAIPEVNIGVMAILAIIGAVFIALGVMFELLGNAAKKIGDGAQNLVDAIKAFIAIPWSEGIDSAKNMGKFIKTVNKQLRNINLFTLIGLTSFSYICKQIANSINAMRGIDEEASASAAAAISVFVETLAESKDAIDATVKIAGDFAKIAWLIALGSAGLLVSSVLLDGVMIALGLFVIAMELYGARIEPAAQMFVQAIVSVSETLNENEETLKKGVRNLISFSAGVFISGGLLAAGTWFFVLAAGFMAEAGATLSDAFASFAAAFIYVGALIQTYSSYLNMATKAIIGFALGANVAGILFALVGLEFFASAVLFGSGLEYFAQSVYNASVYFNLALAQIQEFINGLAGLEEQVIETIQNSPTARTIFSILTPIGEAMFSEGYDFAEDCADGWINGWSANHDEVVEAIEEPISDGLEAAEAEAEVKSPSKRTYRLGNYIVQGLANGITSNKEVVINAAKSLSDELLSTLDTMGKEVEERGNKMSERYANVMKGVGGGGGGAVGRGTHEGSIGTGRQNNQYAEQVQQENEEMAESFDQSEAAAEGAAATTQTYESGMQSGISRAGSTVSGALDWFGSLFHLNMGQAGENTISSWFSSLLSSLGINAEGIKDKVFSLGTILGTLFGDGIGKAVERACRAIAEMTSTNLSQAQEDYLATLPPGIAETVRNSMVTTNRIDTEHSLMKSWRDTFGGMLDSLPSIDDILDFSVPGGSSYTPTTTSDMASAIAGSSGAGSGINDQSKAASIGGGVGNTITNSNNTYNFYQNNYSPEPLNRSAIYQQTRQQLNGFYTYVKEKNLSY